MSGEQWWLQKNDADSWCETAQFYLVMYPHKTNFCSRHANIKIQELTSEGMLNDSVTCAPKIGEGFRQCQINLAESF